MANTKIPSELIADSSITAAKLADGTITTADIADSNVTTAKIANSGVTTAKIGDAQVTTAKITDANVTTGKIADDAVTTAKMASNSVTSDTIASGITLAGATALGSTLAVTGVVTANAGVVVDNITIDGTQIDLSSGDLTLDVAGDIILDAGGQNWFFDDDGTRVFSIAQVSSDVYIGVEAVDKDLFIRVNDGGTAITALAFDASAAGAATFNAGVTTTAVITGGSYNVGGTAVIDSGRNLVNMGNVNGAAGIFGSLEVDNFTLNGTTLALSSGDMTLDAAGRIILSADDNGEIRLQDGSSVYAQFKDDDDRLRIEAMIADKNILFVGTDGATEITALNLDMSAAGAATFNAGATFGGAITSTVVSGGGVYHSITHTGNEAWTWAAQSGSGSDDYLDVGISGGTRCMSWHEDGNVGVGMTSPQRKFEVSTANAEMSHFGQIAGTNGHYTGITLGYREDNINYRKAGIIQEQIGDGAARGHLHLCVDTGADNNSIDVADSKLMIHGTSGNVGIGTAAPGYQLDLRRNDTGNTPSLGIRQLGSGDASMAFQTTTSPYGFIIGVDGSDGDKFKISTGTENVAGATKLTIDASGNVGIGTAAPATELHVKASSGEAEIRIEAVTNSDARLRFGDAADGDAGYIGYNRNSGIMNFSALNTAGVHMAIDSSGRVGIGDAPRSSTRLFASGTVVGARITTTSSTAGHEAIIVNRQNSDGVLIAFSQASNEEGKISVSGSTVTYNGFAGRHESSGIVTSTPIGTVVSTIDELDVYGASSTKAGQTRGDHAKVQISATEGDSCVYGVVSEFNEDGKVYISSVGIGSIKVTGACSRGDLLESNGDGTAKVQSDDIVRSKTIGKVTIGNSSASVKLVSCVLYCG